MSYEEVYMSEPSSPFSKICSLCKLKLSDLKITSHDQSFCCYGCQAVYNILKSSSSLENFATQPVFQQAMKFGLISNPAQVFELKQANEENLIKWPIEIGNMWCFSCADLIQLILLKNQGVFKCVVDYATDLAVIEFSPLEISKEKITKIIQALGYQVLELLDPLQQKVSFNLYLRLAIGAFFGLNIMMFAYPVYAGYFSYDSTGYSQVFAWLSLVCSLPLIFYCATPIFKRFFVGMKAGLLGMEGLVTLGVLTAFLLSLYEILIGTNRIYLDSMAAVIVFVLLGRVIEAKAKVSTKEILFRIHKGLPRKARKHNPEGGEAFVSIKEIAIDDHIVVKQGEKISLDGLVEEGEGTVDESLMTGESYPVIKKIGSQVISGTLLQSGRLVIKVTALSEKSTLQHIINIVEQDIGHKSIYTRAIDRISLFFTPLVIGLAFLTALTVLFFNHWEKTAFETAVIRAITILMISCPCAIGIAAPLAESNLINALSLLGVLVRNRRSLEFLGKETVYVFDKTGTVTEGKFEVQQGLENLTNLQLKALKALTSHSSHPISNAISAVITEKQEAFDSIVEHTGRGLRGSWQNKVFLLGSAKFLREEGVNVPQLNNSLTQVFFAENRVLVTGITLGDKIKKEAHGLMTCLKGKKTVLLSGDAHQVVERIAKELQFSHWESEMTPFEKRGFIEKLKSEGEIVFMLGDGVNDAPAITSAHIGASVVTAADISIQSSDLLLTTEKLKVIHLLSELGRKGHKIIKQNFFWAFFYNILGIGLAVFGFLSPIFAAFAMTASSLIVLFNSKRLSRS